MKSKTTWNDEYKGIGFEIQKFTLCDKDAWAFYLYIPLDALPEDIRERFWLPPQKNDTSRRIHYDYYAESLISDIEWHCGCTYYEKFGMDGEPRAVKIGCDYQHYWDEGHTYSVDYVEMDAKRAIDSFLELVPNMMRRCQWDGRYVPSDQGVMRGEAFYSKEGLEASEKWSREWKEKQDSTKALSSQSK